jgi:hypothetical protein
MSVRTTGIHAAHGSVPELHLKQLNHCIYAIYACCSTEVAEIEDVIGDEIDGEIGVR